MKIIKIKSSLIEPNTGQVEGVPANPRQWTKGDRDRLAKSLKETPELFEARPLIVVKNGGKYVILGGNMRYQAALFLGYEEMPAFVLHDGITAEKMQEIVLKDNGEFGDWNYPLLSYEWKEYDFELLGIELPEAEGYEDKNREIQPADFSENIVLRLRYSEEQADFVKERLGNDRRGALLKLLHYGEEENQGGAGPAQ